MTEFVSMGATELSGRRIENNILSNFATSSIYFYNGGVDSVIQGNQDINHLVVGPQYIVDNGLV